MFPHPGFGWQFMRGDLDARPEISRGLLRRVTEFARPYLWPIVAVLVAIGFTSLLGLLPPLVLRQLIDAAIPQSDLSQINLLALALVVVPVLSGLIGVVQRYFSATIGEGIIFDLRKALYHHMQRMSLRFFTHTRTGEIMARLNTDVIGAQRAVTGTLVQIITNAITLVVTLAVMVALEWRLTLLSILIFPLFILPAQRVAKRLRALSREEMDRNAKMSALMNETLNVNGALLTKVFGRLAHNQTQFDQRAAAVRDIGVRTAMTGRWFFFGLGIVTAIGSALVYWAGARLVVEGAFTIGTIVAFASYLAQLYGPVSALANSRVDFATSMVSFERVFEVIDLPIEIGERPHAHELRDVDGHIRFENVSFSYGEAADNTPAPFARDGSPPANGHHQPAIVRLQSQQRRWEPTDETPDYVQVSERRWATSKVSFEIRPGQLAALVGPSGAGKTTITYLLPRLYDPTDGRILIDGHDLRDVTLHSLASQIGMVTQETFLFHDTLRANLRYARPDASEDELIQAAKVANIYDFIEGLPDGFDTIVGERGYRLSGGEKQRIAIARVILKNPRILILDEATSSLDSQSEAAIQAALKPLFAGRTSLVIAHRLSTILAADIILVMDKGELVEQGTHAELLAQGGLYATLYNTQFRSVTEGALPD